MRVMIILLLSASALWAAEPSARDPQNIAALLQKRVALDAEIAHAKRDWLRGNVDLSPLVVGDRPKDPRESEMRAYREAERLAREIRAANESLSAGERIEGGERFAVEGVLPAERAWPNYDAAYMIVMRNYDALAAGGRVKPIVVDVLGNAKPKEKPKLKAVLADGTVVEQ